MEEKKKSPEEESVHLQDVSGKPSVYRLIAQVNEALLDAIQNRPEEVVIKTMEGPTPSFEEIKSRIEAARAGDWQHDPILGKTPSAKVANLVSELLEHVRAATDLPDAIQKLRPLDPSVLERAWCNELIGILNGALWMFEIVRLVHEREGRATDAEVLALPPSFNERQILDIETELKPARDKLAAHYFGNLRGGLTVQEYFDARVSQRTLTRAHYALHASIEALFEWHEKNASLVEAHITLEDLKGKRSRSKRATKEG